MERTCTKCGKTKEEVDGFYRNGNKRPGYNSVCKDCRREHAKNYYPKHRAKYLARSQKYRQEKPKEYAAAQRKLQLKLYNLTPEEFESLRIQQQNRCAICLKEYHKTLLVDHNHKTGRVRGLLCRKCNTGLGQFCDDPKICWDAAVYLERNSGNWF